MDDLDGFLSDEEEDAPYDQRLIHEIRALSVEEAKDFRNVGNDGRSESQCKECMPWNTMKVGTRSGTQDAPKSTCVVSPIRKKRKPTLPDTIVVAVVFTVLNS
jgi:hypothetical protein